MQANEFINNSELISRLVWACRRGMLELDVLLGNFLKEAFVDLPEGEQGVFVRLLGCQDPELFAWLMGNDCPEDDDLARMVERIRLHARSRF